MRNKITYIAYTIQSKGLLGAIQYFLYGDAKNVCPLESKW
jgi:hypothetical protein